MSSPVPYEQLTLRQLKSLPEVRLFRGWHEMPKAEILRRLAAGETSREQAASDKVGDEESVTKPSGRKKMLAAPKAGENTGKSTGNKAGRSAGKSPGKSADLGAGKNTVKSEGPKKGSRKKQTGTYAASELPSKSIAETGAASDSAASVGAGPAVSGEENKGKTIAARAKSTDQGKDTNPAKSTNRVQNTNQTKNTGQKKSRAGKAAAGGAKKQAAKVSSAAKVDSAAKIDSAEVDSADTIDLNRPKQPAPEMPEKNVNNQESKKAEPPAKEEPEVIESIQVRSDQERLRRLQEEKRLRNTLVTPQIEGQEPEDRLVLTALGPYWLHVWWEISTKMVQKARSVLARDWFTAEPILRLSRGTLSSNGNVRWDIFSEQKIVGGVYNWYLKVDDPPRMFQVEIGYRYKNSFYSMLTSNTVETPENYEQEGMGPMTGWRPRYDTGHYRHDRRSFGGSILLDDEELANLYNAPFHLAVDTEVIIKGTTMPNAKLTIRDRPVKVEPDGSFSVRYRLPERRHIFQVTASTLDGMQSRSIVLAVDRNTKELDTMHDYLEE